MKACQRRQYGENTAKLIRNRFARENKVKSEDEILRERALELAKRVKDNRRLYGP